MTLKHEDRAALFLSVAGGAYLLLSGFAKIWAGRHVAEYTQIIQFGGVKSGALLALIIGLAAIWLLGSLIGIAIACRSRGRLSLRCAATAAAVGVVATILTNTGLFPRTEREVWTILVWLPLASTVVVLVASSLWLRGRGRPRGPEPVGQE